MLSCNLPWLALFLLLTHGISTAQEPAPATDPAAAQEPSADESKSEEDKELLTPERLGAFKFRSIGPALMSGRIADVAVDPRNSNIWYVAVGSGGLWKTTNAGTTFSPVFDGQSSYSMGCVTIDPNDNNIVWVGTGENVGGRHVGVGDGVYRSRDGGQNFENLGLKGTEHISKIVVDPRDSNVVFVAAQGPLWNKGGERGLFRTEDGGATWTNVLSKGEWTGVTDVVIDPVNPDVMYAATHQRHRTIWALLNTGPETGIHKSVDGGRTWRQLTNGLPGEDKGKISLAVSPQKNNVVYATIELPNRSGGFYRSENFGESWEKMSDFVSGATGPHYYQEIYADPHRFDVIYHANVVLVRSVDGGRNFISCEGDHKHSDNHVIAFHPADPEFLLVGTDGGLYRSSDQARTWEFFANLPLTQFYKVDVDYDTPFYHVVGGTQDNNSQYGPAATRFEQGITNEDWRITIGGDGHDNAIVPDNPDILFCESQEGYIRRYDRRTGESVDVRPQPPAGEEGFRFNWDSPILISPHNSKRVYFASKKLHRSDDLGDSWTTVSPDLSRNTDRWTLPIMGRVWGIDAGFDLEAMSAWGNITSISESPVVEGLIYVGTDDGLIQVTEDGGQIWRKIEKIFDIPASCFINDIKADRHDANTVYACLDNHKTGDFKPYVIKSTDRGLTWEPVTGDLPDRHLAWRLEQDHVKPELLFLGTEYGAFTSLDGGKKWHKLAGLPTIPVRDLAIQKRENDLVAATFGRSFYVLDNYAPLRDLTAEKLDAAAHLFPVRRALWYIPLDRLGGRMASQGHGYFTADNPQSGAVFTVHIKESIKSKKEERKEAESKLKESGEDTPLPTWDDLRAEDEEVLPRYCVEIVDAGGSFVRRIDVPGSAGIHRVAWDFRHAPQGMGGFSMLAGPGDYRARVLRLTADGAESIGGEQPFVVESISNPALPAQSQADNSAFLKDLFKVQSNFGKIDEQLERAATEIAAAKEVIASSAAAPSELMKAALAAETELKVLRLKLDGDSNRSSRFVESVPTPRQRLGSALFNIASSTHGPTKTHREQAEIARRELDELRPAISDLIDNRLPALKRQLDEAGLPWTTGR